MKIYLIVFLFQVLFNIFKVLEIKLTYENKVNKLLLNPIFLNIVSLGSIYYSIGELLAGDLIIVIFYLAGSVVGKNCNE